MHRISYRHPHAEDQGIITFAGQLVHLVAHALVIEVVIQQEEKRPGGGSGVTLRGGQQPLPAAAAQEALPAGLRGAGQRRPGEQRPQESLQALQQLSAAPLPAGQLWRERGERSRPRIPALRGPGPAPPRGRRVPLPGNCGHTQWPHTGAPLRPISAAALTNGDGS